MTVDEDKLIYIVDTWFQISGTLKEYVIVLYGLYIWFFTLYRNSCASVCSFVIVSK